MFTILSSIFDESSNKWKVHINVSDTETMYLWFTNEPTQDEVDYIVTKQKQNEIIVETQIAELQCDAFQFRRALNYLSETSIPGLRANVEAIVANSGNQDIIDGWNHAPIFYRYHPFVILVGQTLGLAEEQMDSVIRIGKSF